MSSLYRPTPLEEAYGLYLLQRVFFRDAASGPFEIRGQDAVPFFTLSGVDRLILRNIWSTVDHHNVGKLTEPLQFYTALRLIALAKSGILLACLADAFEAKQTPVAAMVACVRATSNEVLSLPVFEGIPMPSTNELHQLYAARISSSLTPSGLSIGATTSSLGLSDESTQQANMVSPISVSVVVVGSSSTFAPSENMAQQRLSIDDAFGGLVDVQDTPLPSLTTSMTTEAISNTMDAETFSDLDSRLLTGSMATREDPGASVGSVATTASVMSVTDAVGMGTSQTSWTDPRASNGSGTTMISIVSVADAFGNSNIASAEQHVQAIGTVALQDDDEDEFGDFTAVSTASDMEPSSFGVFDSGAHAAGFVPATMASNEPSGWDALDALASDIPDAPLPALPTPDVSFDIDVGGATDSQDDDDFGDFASPECNVEPLAPQLSVLEDDPVGGKVQISTAPEPFSGLEAVSSAPVSEHVLFSLPDTSKVVTAPVPVVGFAALDALGEIQNAPLPKLEDFTAPLNVSSSLNNEDEETDGFGDFVGTETTLTDTGKVATGSLVENESFAASRLGAPASFTRGATSSLESEPVEHSASLPTSQTSGWDALAASSDATLPALPSSFDEHARGGAERVRESHSSEALSEIVDDLRDECGGFKGYVEEVRSTSPGETGLHLTELSSSLDMISRDSQAPSLDEAPIRQNVLSESGSTGDRSSLPSRSLFSNNGRIDSEYYSAASSVATDDLDGFESAAETEEEKAAAGTSDVDNYGAGFGVPASSAAGEESDDPFAAFDSLAPPVPQLPSLPGWTSSNEQGQRIGSSNDADSESVDKYSGATKEAYGQRPLTLIDAANSTTLDTIAENSVDMFAPLSLTAPSASIVVIGDQKSHISGTKAITTMDIREASESDTFGDFESAEIALGTVSDGVTPGPDQVEVGIQNPHAALAHPIDASESDTFGDFESADFMQEIPVAVSGNDVFDHVADIAPNSLPDTPVDSFDPIVGGTGNNKVSVVNFGSTEPSLAAATVDEDDFGDFDSSELVDTPVSSQDVDDPFCISTPKAPQEHSESDWDDFQGPPTMSMSPEDVAKNELTVWRQQIIDVSLRLPEAFRHRLDDSVEHIDFADCFDANIGVEVPITPLRRRRVSRCLQLLDRLASSHSKLASTYWEQAIKVVHEELSLGVMLLEQASTFSAVELDQCRRKLEVFVFGLGEFVRIVRCIEATIGDALLLDTSALLTVDTLTSSWCSVPLLKDALQVEKLWKDIEQLVLLLKLRNKQDTPHWLPSLMELRRLAALVDLTNAALDWFTLQPLSSRSAQKATMSTVEYQGHTFMACTANFVVRKCPSYVS